MKNVFVSRGPVQVDALRTRIQELESEGVPHAEAFERARLEQCIHSWPDAWGDYLEVMLYGGIKVSSDIEVRELGLSISSERKTGNFVFGASSAYTCKLKVNSRDLPGVLDAIQRLETFLNSWHVISWGATIHYYCSFLSPAIGTDGHGVSSLPKNQEEIQQFLSALGEYRLHEKKLVLRAAWWLRQSQHSFLSGVSNPSIFAQYSAYWNAFECLVEVFGDLAPLPSSSSTQKAKNVTDFFQHLSAPPTPSDVATCYQLYVNPGLPQRARHALALAFGPVGEQYFHLCFQQKPKQYQLYQIRNDINHANIVEFNLDDRLRVENGLDRLSYIVLNMFFTLTRRSIILDRNVQACHTCTNLNESALCKLNLLPANTAYWRYICNAYERKTK
jgi:hypothetical protein